MFSFFKITIRQQHNVVDNYTYADDELTISVIEISDIKIENLIMLMLILLILIMLMFIMLMLVTIKKFLNT